MTALHQFFSHICGQVHVWNVGGAPLPVCQRCTGLYVGAACAVALWFAFRPRPTHAVLWLHGAALLLMIPFGYHLVPQNAVVRTLTGYIFAFGLVYFLLLVPAERLRLRATVHVVRYGTGAATCAAALIALLRSGGSAAAALLAWAIVAGWAALALLATANLALLPFVFRRTPAPAP